MVPHGACLRKNEHIYFAVELSMREISYVMYVHALIYAHQRLTRKTRAVGIRKESSADSNFYKHL